MFTDKAYWIIAGVLLLAMVATGWSVGARWSLLLAVPLAGVGAGIILFIYDQFMAFWSKR